MQPFYLYGQLIAVLEQGARAHGQIPWLELYYPRGFLPWVGLHDPLQKHLQSVLPFLERRGRSDRYLARLNSLANALENTGEPPQDSASFNSWCTRYLSHDRSPKPELPLKSTPRARRCTPRATWMNARPSSLSAHRCQETRTSFSSVGITTRADCSPGTSQVTTLASRQAYNWVSKTGEP